MLPPLFSSSFDPLFVSVDGAVLSSDGLLEETDELVLLEVDEVSDEVSESLSELLAVDPSDTVPEVPISELLSVLSVLFVLSTLSVSSVLSTLSAASILSTLSASEKSPLIGFLLEQPVASKTAIKANTADFFMNLFILRSFSANKTISFNMYTIFILTLYDVFVNDFKQ